MAIFEMLSWWYAHGWNVFVQKNRHTLSNIVDFFSMNSLIRTLFKPFRQISAETASADSSLELKMHMFLDRLISRFIGFFSRLFLLIAGTIIIITGAICSLVLVLLWPIVPLIPIAGIILTVAGVVL